MVDAAVLLKEIRGLNERGVDTSRLLLSSNAHLITSYHDDRQGHGALPRQEPDRHDRARHRPDVRRQDQPDGIRVADIFDEKILTQKIEAALEQKNHLLVKVYNRRAIEVDAVLEEIAAYADDIKPLVADTSRVINAALDEDKTVLFEGAQATMLDVDHGTYPFVTSSNPTAGGVCAGVGVGPTRIDRVIGVVKAYTTRVGAGLFPTELFDEDGEQLRQIGAEFGTTTGRERRCGWYDAVIARYAAR